MRRSTPARSGKAAAGGASGGSPDGRAPGDARGGRAHGGSRGGRAHGDPRGGSAHGHPRGGRTPGDPRVALASSGSRSRAAGREGREAGTAAPLVPAGGTLDQVRDAAAECRACPLWERGTQTVFGAGPRRADVVLVGE